jgi:hypothetical protein
MDEQPTQQSPSQYKSWVRDNGSYNEASVIEKRLNTSEVLEKIQIYISGCVTIFETDEKGKLKKITKPMGKAKCNDEGLQAILGFVTSVVNSQVVQGNYEIEQYKYHCFYMRNELTKQIVINMKDWAIISKDAESIIDFIMNLIEPFMSRLVDNKERDSYASSLRVSESATSDREKQGWLSGIFGGKR